MVRDVGQSSDGRCWILLYLTIHPPAGLEPLARHGEPTRLALELHVSEHADLISAIELITVSRA